MLDIKLYIYIVNLLACLVLETVVQPLFTRSVLQREVIDNIDTNTNGNTCAAILEQQSEDSDAC